MQLYPQTCALVNNIVDFINLTLVEVLLAIFFSNITSESKFHCRLLEINFNNLLL